MTFGPSTACGETRLHFDAMASRDEIVVAGMGTAAANAALQAAAAEVLRIEAKYSRYRDDSVVSRINASAGARAGVLVDIETAGLLDFSGRLFELSDGLFDVTSG